MEAVGGGPTTVDEAGILMQTMSNTTVIVFDKIDRPEYRQDLYQLDFIKSHFQFTFVKNKDNGEVTVRYRRRSSDEKEVKGDSWYEETFVPKKTVSRKQKKQPTPRAIKSAPHIPSGLSLSASPAASSEQQEVSEEGKEEKKEKQKKQRATPKKKKAPTAIKHKRGRRVTIDDSSTSTSSSGSSSSSGSGSGGGQEDDDEGGGGAKPLLKKQKTTAAMSSVGTRNKKKQPQQ